MHRTLLLVGLGLALVGWVLVRSRPGPFTRATAVGVVSIVVGEVLLYGEGWLWALIGLVAPGLLIDVITGVMAAISRPR
jgi:hypothetical protein